MKTNPLMGKLHVSGVLEFLDKEGNILGTTEIKGSIPLTEEETTEVVKELGNDDGTNDSK